MFEILVVSLTVGLVGTSFSNTVSLGSTVIACLLAAGTIIGIIYGTKWKTTAQTAAATITLLEANANGHADAAKLATEAAKDFQVRSAAEKEDLLRTIAKDREEIGELRGRPDLEALHNRLIEHDTKAGQRDDKILEALTRIADRLDPPVESAAHS